MTNDVSAGAALRKRLTAGGIEWRPDEVEMIALAGAVADEIQRLETELGDGPRVVEGSRGQAVTHPLVAELRLQTALLLSLLRALDMPEGEPGSWDHLTASQRARRAARARWNDRGGAGG